MAGRCGGGGGRGCAGSCSDCALPFRTNTTRLPRAGVEAALSIDESGRAGGGLVAVAAAATFGPDAAAGAAASGPTAAAEAVAALEARRTSTMRERALLLCACALAAVRGCAAAGGVGAKARGAAAAAAIGPSCVCPSVGFFGRPLNCPSKTHL